MNISFKEIEIENFKNIEWLETSFWDRKTIVYGANETGKTTFADAISWCLTGKNSLGESQFEFVPIGQKGVSPSVTLSMDIDVGKKDYVDHVILQRVYQAKQNKAKEFTGEYVTVCYINKLKVGVKEFEKWVEGHICNPEIFRLIHDVRYFTEGIAANGHERQWEAQRRLLFSISGIKPDVEFARSKKRFAPLLDGLQKYDNAGQYLSFLKSEEKRLNEKVRYCNSRLETAKAMIGEVETFDEDAERRLKELEKEKRKLDAEIMQETERIREEREKELKRLQGEIDKKTTKFERERFDYSEKFGELNRKRKQLEDSGNALWCNLVATQLDLKKAKDAYEHIEIQCPTCGQYMPSELIDEKKEELEGNISELQKLVDDFQKRFGKNAKDLERVEKDIESLKAPEYPEELRGLQNHMACVGVGERSSEGKESVRKKNKITEEMNVLIAQKASADRFKKMKEAMEKVEEEAANCIDEKANNSKMMDLCREFIDAKCKYAEKKVNEMFDGIEFKMFRRNKTNDEVKECCDIFWNGVPYSSLSYSTKFVVSMKIALGFQRYYKVSMPIMVDNAESIDFEMDVEAQMVLLVKREEDCECGGETGRKEADGLWTCKKCGKRFKKQLAIERE